jgi:hypothetical protein
MRQCWMRGEEPIPDPIQVSAHLIYPMRINAHSSPSFVSFCGNGFLCEGRYMKLRLDNKPQKHRTQTIRFVGQRVMEWLVGNLPEGVQKILPPTAKQTRFGSDYR